MTILLEFPGLGAAITIPTTTGKIVEIDRIDMRLEDLGKYSGHKIKDMYNWAGELPHLPGRYLTHDHGIVSADKVRGLGLIVLPPDWWEYTSGTLKGQVVKAPKHHRPDRGEVTQEYIDQHGPHGVAESYERRLARVLCGWL